MMCEGKIRHNALDQFVKIYSGKVIEITNQKFYETFYEEDAAVVKNELVSESEVEFLVIAQIELWEIIWIKLDEDYL
jgi:hypothetical protein